MVSIPGHGYRRTGTPSSTTTYVVLIAAIIVLGIYCWSLSSENKSLRNTMLHTYTKLRQVANLKVNLEKRNTILSNRMVEMEEQRDSAKETKDQEKISREHCEKLLSAKDQQLEDAQAQLKKIMDEVYPDRKAENPEEEQALGKHSDINFETIMQKIKDTKMSLTSVRQDYMLLQNKYTNLDKEFVETRRKKEQCEKGSSLNAKRRAAHKDETETIATEPSQATASRNVKEERVAEPKGLKEQDRAKPTKEIRKAARPRNSLARLKQKRKKLLKLQAMRKLRKERKREVSSTSPNSEPTSSAHDAIQTERLALQSTLGSPSEEEKEEKKVATTVEVPQKKLHRAHILKQVEVTKAEKIGKKDKAIMDNDVDGRKRAKVLSNLRPMNKESDENEDEAESESHVQADEELERDNTTS